MNVDWAERSRRARRIAVTVVWFAGAHTGIALAHIATSITSVRMHWSLFVPLGLSVALNCAAIWLWQSARHPGS